MKKLRLGHVLGQETGTIGSGGVCSVRRLPIRFTVGTGGTIGSGSDSFTFLIKEGLGRQAAPTFPLNPLITPTIWRVCCPRRVFASNPLAAARQNAWF